MGTKRGKKGFREEGRPTEDPLGLYRARYGASATPEKRKPTYSPVTLRALHALHLDETADAQAIRSRYKELVKRHHPDANGGDRSREEKLREIIHAYKTLRAARLA
jgi:DnaJ-domain-containing protein 1